MDLICFGLALSPKGVRQERMAPWLNVIIGSINAMDTALDRIPAVVDNEATLGREMNVSNVHGVV